MSQIATETDPLISSPTPTRPKKFYRARPLWLVPFMIVASVVRGMTLASRIEVYTELNCARLHPDHTAYDPLNSFSLDRPHLYASWDSTNSYFVMPPYNDTSSATPNSPMTCYSDPDVQAGAALTGAIFMTTMGILSAFTTGFWGQFGQRHGRTRVLAVSTAGLLATDLAFILVSTPSSNLSLSLRHQILLLAPICEGLSGGWSTVSATTSAYISDCTSPGSRAPLFSRFTGILYLGFGLGPVLGGIILKQRLGVTLNALLGFTSTSSLVNLVFYIAVAGSFFNFLGALWMFPESLSREARESATFAYNGRGKGKGRATLPLPSAGESSSSDDTGPAPSESVIAKFLSPLAIFLPVKILDNGRKRTDWSLTLLALSLVGFMLVMGIYQIKYLYAEHTYGWSPSQLSWYISWLGMFRAFYLLFLLPAILAALKPRNSETNASTFGKKPPLTMARIVREMTFDLSVIRWSVIIDILSNVCVVLVPDPSYRVHELIMQRNVPNHSQALFVAASSLSSFGAGSMPAIHSLALCILQARSICNGDPPTDSTRSGIEGSLSLPEVPAQTQTVESDIESGKLFGALALLQAVGQMILGPMLFGFVYSGTVATYPKAIFLLASGILTISLASLLLVRPPGTGKPALLKKKKQVKKPVRFQRSSEVEVSRGRSTRSKDLRRLSISESQIASGSKTAQLECV